MQQKTVTLPNKPISRRPTAHDETGQALVEFALVLPLLLLLILCAIEFGWLGYQRINFEYACTHANWGYVKDQFKDYGDYTDTNPVEITDVADAAIKKAVTSSGWFGMDSAKMGVTNAKVILSSTSSDFDVPNYDKKPHAATQYTRYMHATGEVQYVAKPLLGLFLPDINMRRTITYNQIIGQQRRSY